MRADAIMLLIQSSKVQDSDISKSILDMTEARKGQIYHDCGFEESIRMEFGLQAAQGVCSVFELICG